MEKLWLVHQSNEILLSQNLKNKKISAAPQKSAYFNYFAHRLKIDKDWLKFSQSINSLRIFKTKLKCYLNTDSPFGKLRISVLNTNFNQNKNSFGLNFQNSMRVFKDVQIKNKIILDLSSTSSLKYKLLSKGLHHVFEKPIFEDLLENKFKSESEVDFNFIKWSYDKYEREYVCADVLKLSMARLKFSFDDQLFEGI